MKVNKVKLTVTLSSLLIFIIFFYAGYRIGLNQAEMTFPEPEETWKKEIAVGIDAGVSPDVVRLSDASWRMYYAVKEGIVSAVSQNGRQWSKEEGTRLQPVQGSHDQALIGSPSVVKLKDGSYRMFYEGSDVDQKHFIVFSAVSADGTTWKKESGKRLEDKNKNGQNVAAAPDVVKTKDEKWYMFYSDGNSIKMAVSTNEGMEWQKRGLNGLPPATLDPSVIVMSDGVFRMYFAQSALTDKLSRVRIMSASSVNGSDWNVDKGVRVAADKDASMVFDPDVILVSMGLMKMYYSQLDKGILDGKGKNAPVVSIRSANLELK